MSEQVYDLKYIHDDHKDVEIVLAIKASSEKEAIRKAEVFIFDIIKPNRIFGEVRSNAS